MTNIHRNIIKSFITLLTSATFWIAASAIGALITLYFISIDISHTADLNAYQFLRKEDERFRSVEMKNNRNKLAGVLLTKGDNYENIYSLLDDYDYDVMDYFDDMGVIMKKKIAPSDLIWTMFSYEIILYWNALKGYIYWMRKVENAPYYYSDFERLYYEMARIEKIKHPHKDIVFTKEKIHDDLIYELLPEDRMKYLAREDSLKGKSMIRK